MIRINSEYVIDCDEVQYILRRDKQKKDKRGRDVLEALGYYSTLEHALKGYVDYITKKRHADAEISVREAVMICREERRELEDLLKKYVRG